MHTFVSIKCYVGMAFSQILFILILVFHVSVTMSIEASNSGISKSGCPSNCGNVSIPYPFGIGHGCYKDKAFEIICDNTTSKPYLPFISREVLQLSLKELRVRAHTTKLCYDPSTGKINASSRKTNYGGHGLPRDGPFTYSNTRNNFVVVGCDIFAYVSDIVADNLLSGCVSQCPRRINMDLYNGSCFGVGCCKTAIPGGLKQFQMRAYGVNTQACGYASIHDGSDSLIEKYSKLLSHNNLSTTLPNNYDQLLNVGATLDWSMGVETCDKVSKHECGENSQCFNASNTPGYRCQCLPGLEGNPYLPNGCTVAECKNATHHGCGENSGCVTLDGEQYRCHCVPGYEGNPYLGCQDVNECENGEAKCETEPRSGGLAALCVNTPGSYACECPDGTIGDATTDGVRCLPVYVHPDHKRATVLIPSIGSGVGLGLLLVLAIGFRFYREMKRRKHIKLKQKFFKRNGGLLLEQQISPGDGNIERTKVFVTEELETATNNFNESRIIGRGGSGTVYKGMLSDGRIVAIKKSKIIDESQIVQFINELVILSQINHRNIVRLLGCCLETEVPLLVYEYVSNGTLSHHLHDESYFASISWTDRLRISREISGALSYLHSSASMPIFHRDIKSSNILLDERNRAKVSDFGISRSVPFDKTHLTTLVQGTFGYLDPEYFHSGQFTEKSDVYSFGVVLVELLTGEKPVNYTKAEEDKNLAMHFISAMKDGCLVQVLEQRVVKEASKEDVLIVAKLAKRCLKVVGKKRPAMREVANELEKLTNCQDQDYHVPNCENNNHYLVGAEDEEEELSI